MNEDLHFAGKHADVLIAKRLKTPFKPNATPDSIFDTPYQPFAPSTPSKTSSSTSDSAQEVELKTPVKTGVVGLPIGDNLENTVISAPFTSPTSMAFSPQIALKSQVIRSPKDISDQAYRELLIYKSLTQLKEQGLCFGFVSLYDWFKSKGNYFEVPQTPVPQPPAGSSSPSSQAVVAKPKRRRTDHQTHEYMNYILERADETMFAYLSKCGRTLPASRFKSILFQLIFALHMAQRECQFVHNDLHLKNILTKNLDKVDCFTFSLEGKFWKIQDNFMVKITDFGLSRIRLPSGHVVSSKASVLSEFSTSKDIEQISKEFAKIKIDWTELEGKVDVQKEQALLRDLKCKMKRLDVTAADILRHEFFASLVITPQYDEKGNLKKGEQTMFCGDFAPEAPTPTAKSIVGSNHNKDHDKLFDMILKQEALDFDSLSDDEDQPKSEHDDQTSPPGSPATPKRRRKVTRASKRINSEIQDSAGDDSQAAKPKRRRISLKK